MAPNSNLSPRCHSGGGSKMSSHQGGTHDRHSSSGKLSEFEYSALESMIAVLCCGPFFNEAGQSEEGPLYQFLDGLLESQEQRVSLQILPPFQKSRNASPPSTVTRLLGSFLRMTTRRHVSTKGLRRVSSARAHGR